MCFLTQPAPELIVKVTFLLNVYAVFKNRYQCDVSRKTVNQKVAEKRDFSELLITSVFLLV